MRENIRYPSSALTALVVSFFTFLGMTTLITTQKLQRVDSVEMAEFTKINDVEKPKEVVPNPPKPTQQTKTTQPPAAPSLDVTESLDRTDVQLPSNNVVVKDFDINTLDLPNISLGKPGTGQGTDGGLIQLVAIEPIYPHQAALKKTEGWVKVEFIVNKLGYVSQAKVVDAQPKNVFNRATIRAIKKSKFKPLMIDGKPVEQTAVQVIEFKLEK